MNSFRDPKFIKLFDQLPAHIQRLAVKNFQLWRDNHRHPSLDFKELRNDCWSVRIGDHFRAVGVKDGDAVIWFWIGTHEKYNNLF